MLKKFFLLTLVVVTVLGVSAQHAPGSWRVLPMSGLDFEDIVDTPDKVYYLTGNSLYCYDKEANETIYYTPGTKISDSGIQSIAYNKNGKYLLCAYTNGNIDLIYDSGKVVNMPEIKEANLVTEKSINDVAMTDNKIYAATPFGIVIFDDKKHVVVESAIFNAPVERIAVLGDNLVILKNDEKGSMAMYTSPLADRHNTIDKFTKISNVGNTPICPVGGNSYITLSGNTLSKYTLNGGLQFNSNIATVPNAKRIQTCKDGYFVVSDNGITTVSETDGNAATINIPAEFKSQILSFYSSPKSVWAGNSEGIGNYDLSTSTATVRRDKYFPVSSKQFNNCYATNTPDGTEVYFNGISRSDYHPSGYDSADRFQDFLTHESYNWNTGEITRRYPMPSLKGGMGRTLIDPVNPEIMYTVRNTYGFSIIIDNKEVRLFDDTNSPLIKAWNGFLFELSFDPFGNLWIGMWNALKSDWTWRDIVHFPTVYTVLKKSGLDKLRANINAELQTSDWQRTAFPASYDCKSDPRIAFSSRDNKAIHILGAFGASIWGYDTKGTSDTSDDVVQEYTSVTDQDGNSSNPTYKAWVVADKTGDIWMGTTTGIYVVKDLDQIADGSAKTLMTIRPKVARNDGTNYADYLLASEQILCIAVDSNNNKWIGTEDSGLYYVNEDGTEILAEYNTDNSPLLSNTITMLACNPNGNDILIGTPKGIFVYSSDSAPAADDYSTVYAYPNPVRPDYTGWITINGLMDNSLVKITDAQGHVVWQGQSEGGLTVWDGCDTTGSRVRSGVYMVYASQNATGDASGAVTKIVVIN